MDKKRNRAGRGEDDGSENPVAAATKRVTSRRVKRANGSAFDSESDASSSTRMILDSDTSIQRHDSQSPLHRAIKAHTLSFQSNMNSHTLSNSVLSSLYTLRLSLTASHELLHCFGLDHCVYFACAMQGTASLSEDSRQPPYLCPVCENKLAAALVVRVKQGEKTKTVSEAWWEAKEVNQWRRDRRRALVGVCEAVGFASLGAWYRGVMKMELDGMES